MRRQRVAGGEAGDMMLFFGARTPKALPYYAALGKMPESVMKRHLVFSRAEDSPKEYVQDRMIGESAVIAEMIADPATHVYICGLRSMEQGVEQAFEQISASIGLPWRATRDMMRSEGRFHVETY